MERSYTLFEGFIAAALHDIGKLALKNNTWAQHEDLRAVGKRTGIDFVELLGENVVDLISIHHGNVRKGVFDLSKLSNIEYALVLSDKIQSSMYPRKEVEERVGKEDLDRVKNRERYFTPYYGPLKRWDDSEANGRLNGLIDELNKLRKFKERSNHGRWANNILSVQDKLLNYPLLTFMPHLSLAMHHQLSAALFLFLCDELEKYDDLKDLREFKFSVIEITPELLKTFYRMRDVSGMHSMTEELSTKVVGKLFGQYRRELNGIPNKKSNPFLFYNKNSFVLVHPSPSSVLETLRELSNGLDLFYSLTVKVNEYVCEIDRTPGEKISGIFARGQPVSRRCYTILSDKLLSDDLHPAHICMACGKPIKDGREDDKGHLLCDLCRNLRKKSTGYDLDVFGGPGERLSYIFLTLPEDLIKHSKEVAEEQLISRFLNECKIAPYSIPPTDCGILEYLQALRELSLFQEDVDGLITGDYETTLFKSPQFTGYLFRETEDQPWDFIRYLNVKRSNMVLNPSMVLMSCNTKTPFWSLIESMPTYNNSKGDVIYDISGGSVTMFQSVEVSKIRELSEIARKNNVTSTQLNNLSDVALTTNSDELRLELDVRKDRLGQFGERLADAIKQPEMDGNEYQRRIKRSIFIKYIGKLVKYSKKRW